MNTLLSAAIKSRNDVDRIFLDNSTVISWGNLPDGTPVQFDRSSLDITDRIIAVYLSQQFSGIVGSSFAGARTSGELNISPSDTSQEQFSGIVGSSFAGARTSGGLNISPSDASQVVNQTLQMMVNRTGIVALVQYFQGSGNSIDPGLAVGDSLVSVLAASSSTIGPEPAAQAGMVTSLGKVYNTVNNMMRDITGLVPQCNGDPGCTATQAANIDNIIQGDGAKAVSAIASLYAKIPIVAGLEDNTAALTSGLLNFSSKLFNLGSSGALPRDDQTTANVIQTPVLTKLGRVTGNVDIPNSQGIAAAQSSIGLAGFDGASALGIQGLADQSGGFSLVVPLGVPNTPYNSLTLSAFNPISGNTLGSKTVDLSGLDATHPVQVPPFSFNQFTTTNYDGTYNGNLSGNVTCVAADGSTLVQPVPLAPFGFTLTNGAVVGSGLSGGVDFFGHLNITIPVSGVGAVTFVGTIAFTGLANGTWTESGLPDGCTEGGTWSAARQ
jgi:hypothetical protein